MEATLEKVEGINEIAGYGVMFTPALVIDGRYLVLGNSYQSLLDNANRILKAIAPAASKPAAK